MHVLKLTKIAQMDQQKVCIILAKNMFTAQACKYFQDRNKKKNASQSYVWNCNYGNKNCKQSSEKIEIITTN